MLRLLVDEEQLLGCTREQLNEIERHIAHIKDIIVKQLETITMLKANGYSIEKAETLLSQITDLLIVHQERRVGIEAALPLRPSPGWVSGKANPR